MSHKIHPKGNNRIKEHPLSIIRLKMRMQLKRILKRNFCNATLEIKKGNSIGRNYKKY